jgi:hypothetical protein
VYGAHGIPLVNGLLVHQDGTHPVSYDVWNQRSLGQVIGE